MFNHQRLETNLKSQTLPRLDGNDEEYDGLDNQFEILSISNSCPDLSILELEDENGTFPIASNFPEEDVVDGIFQKRTQGLPKKLPLNFRRSTSLNSLGTEEFEREATSVDGNAISGHESGAVAKAIENIEKCFSRNVGSSGLHSATSSNRGSFGASHNGTLQKSVSSPSVPQYIREVPLRSGGVQHGVLDTRRTQPRAQQPQGSKRSFFKRKNKTKRSALPARPLEPASFSKMNGPEHELTLDRFQSSVESVGAFALTDETLGLQDIDSECWAHSMDPEIVAQLDDKEVKRQEHMYEMILTEKHHCLTLALMDHLFVSGMRKQGFSRLANYLFPGLLELLEVHFSFLRRMRERQLHFRNQGKPMDTLADILTDHFTGKQWHNMIRLYGLLCSSHAKSLDLFKAELKKPKFASLVALWSKEPLLSRKNVPECLLLVAQRITKYPLLIDPLRKTETQDHYREQLLKTLESSKALISKVNERVAERQSLTEICQKMDKNSIAMVGKLRIGRDEILASPSRRLLFSGKAFVNCNRVEMNSKINGQPAVQCNVFILNDSIIFTQEISGRLHLATPPGLLMLKSLFVREDARQNANLFVFMYNGSTTEMITLQVIEPPQREVWHDLMLDSINKAPEWETGSEGDGEINGDSLDYSDSRISKTLEELQEQDKQILTMLRSRSKLIESLRSEKPHHWAVNNFEGKDALLNAMSVASNEVQRLIQQDLSNGNSVNRSASCAGEHMSSSGLTGLPKRADTFGGFDTQQRSAFDSHSNLNNKVLFQMIIQLADVCGELFQQMIPQQSQHVPQSTLQLHRRMEDLREAQKRLEDEKAQWALDLMKQKEAIDRAQEELIAFKDSLQKEEADISQQREQLYRKLEALQKKGIHPTLDSVSPVSLNPPIEKTSSSTAQIRRTATQSHHPSAPNPNVSPGAGGGNTAKQQLPLKLANFSAAKAAVGSPIGPELVSSLASRVSLKGNSGGEIHPSPVLRGSQASRGGLANTNKGIQQMLPLRLSEGLAAKSSSLPRSVGSRSATNVATLDQHQGQNPHLRTSVSSTYFPPGNAGGMEGTSNPSYLYGPSTNDRMSSYYKNPPHGTNQGFGDGRSNQGTTNASVPIVHRRSGSSPVSFTSNYQNQQHQFFLDQFGNEEDLDSSKILFL